MQTILIVDDDPMIVRAITRAFEDYPVTITSASSLDAAVRALKEARFDAVVTDFELGPSETGVDVLREVQRMQPWSRLVLLSGSDPDEVRAATEAAGVSAALVAKAQGVRVLRQVLGLG